MSGVEPFDLRMGVEAQTDWQALLGEAGLSLVEGVVICDREGRIRATNPSAQRLLGRDADSLEGLSPCDDGWRAIRPDGTPLPVEAHPALLTMADGRPRRRVRLGVRRPDGACAWVALNASPLRHPGEEEPYGAICSFLDVAADVAAHERLRTLFEEAPIGMAHVSLDGRVAEVNAALCDILREPRRILEGAPVWQFVHEEDRTLDERLVRALGAGELPRFTVERRLLRGDGRPVWAQIDVSVVRGAGARPASAIVQVQDITERRRLEERMRHLAEHDSLSGVLNRRAFADALERHVAGIRRYGPAGALLLVDLDHFKGVNDTHGHAVGDAVLRAVAELLRERLRETDAVARLGGDEFAVLLPRADAGEALRVAEELVLLLPDRLALPPGSGRTRVTASVGVAMFDAAEPSAEQAMMRADLAMYEAKAAGRGRAVAYAAS